MNADPFTLASPQYRVAVQTCQRSGAAFEVTRSRPWARLGRLFVQLLAVVGFFAVAFAGIACLAVR